EAIDVEEVRIKGRHVTAILVPERQYQLVDTVIREHIEVADPELFVMQMAFEIRPVHGENDNAAIFQIRLFGRVLRELKRVSAGGTPGPPIREIERRIHQAGTIGAGQNDGRFPLVSRALPDREG